MLSLYLVVDIVKILRISRDCSSHYDHGEQQRAHYTNIHQKKSQRKLYTTYVHYTIYIIQVIFLTDIVITGIYDTFLKLKKRLGVGAVDILNKNYIMNAAKTKKSIYQNWGSTLQNKLLFSEVPY